MERDFKRAIGEARARLADVQMPPEVDARVRLVLRTGGRRRLPPLFLGLVTGAAAAAGVVWLAARPAPGLALPEGFSAVDLSTDVRLDVSGAGKTIRIERGSCALKVRGWGRVTLHSGAVLRRAGGGLELTAGRADFQVDKRSSAQGPTFVRVPEATIEITGTRFSILERPDGGSVHLDEGAIRFRALDGRTVTLAPGQSLDWPLPPAPPAETRPEVVATPSAKRDVPAEPTLPRPRRAPPAPPRPAAAPDSSGIVERIAQLRADGDYAELARELAAALDAERRPLTRERLSFELGSVLTYHFSDRAKACAHWSGHLRDFPNGHYQEEATDARQRLGCDPKEKGR